MELTVHIGYDRNFIDAHRVAIESLRSHASIPIKVKSLVMPVLQNSGIYRRPTEHRDGQLFDIISDAPMATEFALSRFFIPYIQGYQGVSLFCDSDFLFRADIAELMALYDPRYAVQCVKHKHQPTDTVKMDGKAQTSYARKNWSSFMLINNAHPANRKLNLDMANTTRGRDLHRFCWMADDEIGELPQEWNWLAGITTLEQSPKAVHYTLGTPDMAGYENEAFANEWRDVLRGLDADRQA